MNKPSAEYLTQVMTKHGTDAGYHQLRREGYDVPRSVCAKVRRDLVRQGAVSNPRDAWSDYRLDKVRDLAAKGCTAAAIAHELGTTKFAIHAVCQSRGIMLRKGNTIDMPPLDKVEATFHKFTSMTAAANSLGICEHTFRRWVKHYNLKRVVTEKPPRAPKPRRKFGVTYTPTPVTTPTETGPLADAARYLRQQGYANVYRRSRDEWQVGARPMSEKDMLSRVDEIKARRARMMGGVA